MLRLVGSALASALLLLATSHSALFCGAAPTPATWSVNVATGFTTADYSNLLSPINNAQDANWLVEPPRTRTQQPARLTYPGSNNWPGPAWVANGPLSAWVSVSANDQTLGYGGPYPFTRSFQVPSAVVASSVVFNGAVSCDNLCNLLLNGVRISPLWNDAYASLIPITVNLGSSIRPGQLNTLVMNLTDFGSQNAMRVEGTISGTLANYWSMDVASGFTTPQFTSALSTTNGDKDAHWMAKRPQWTSPQPAEICTPSGGNWPFAFGVSPWLANGPKSAWIAIGCSSYTQGSGGPYDFLYTFTMPAGTDPYSVSFVGGFTCDDVCNLLINGQPVGPSYYEPYAALRYFSFDWSAGWNMNGLNTIAINLTDNSASNGVRIEGTVQARLRASSSSSTAAVRPRACPYWAVGRYYPQCQCPEEGVFPRCECPAPYRGTVPYDCYALYPDPDEPYQPGTSTGAAGGSSSGLSTTAIVFIVLAVVAVAAVSGYLYYRHTKNAASGAAAVQENWHDKATLLPGQTSTASHGQPAQSGLDYYTQAPANGQVSGRPGVELH